MELELGGSDSAGALKERLKKHSELAGVARDVLQLLSSENLLQKSKDNLETVEKISSKVEKGKENTVSTIESKGLACIRHPADYCMSKSIAQLYCMSVAHCMLALNQEAQLPQPLA
jgi:hypothetical protein